MNEIDANEALRALVVGAETVVGASVATQLADRGCLVDTLPGEACRYQGGAHTAVARAVSALGGLDALIITSWGPTLTTPLAVEAITDADLEAGWEGSMLTLIWALQAAYPALVRTRGTVVVILPTTGMSGGRQYSLAAATFEAQRILVKATARQWGPVGIRINTLAIAPESVLADANAADVHYLAPAALGDDQSDDKRADDLLGAVALLLARQSSGLTGQTIGVDGGRWLAP